MLGYILVFIFRFQFSIFNFFRCIIYESSHEFVQLILQLLYPFPYLYVCACLRHYLPHASLSPSHTQTAELSLTACILVSKSDRAKALLASTQCIMLCVCVLFYGPVCCFVAKMRPSNPRAHEQCFACGAAFALCCNF